MKRVNTMIVLLLAVCTMYGQDIVGTWNGAFTVEPPEGEAVTLRISFHITASETGFTSTLDSPDQNAFGIATDATTYENTDLTVKISQLDFVYTGKLKDAKTIEGSFTQMGQTFKLDLTREEE
jgi:hypothetical protein